MIRTIVCGIVLILAILTKSYGQYFTTGENPASVKWKQIKTEEFQVIFPEEVEHIAIHLSGILEEVYDLATITLNHKPKKTSVLLYNQTVSSNAYAIWAPKRIEIFTIPPQKTDPEEWLEQLAVHEYRHIIQISQLNQGFTKIVSAIFGQQGTAAVLGLYVPLWFLEGDAICAETALSHSGRGRNAEFMQKMRAQTIGKQIYSYDKAYLGSFKDFIPSHYHLGYLLTSYGRYKYGPGFWSNTIDNTGKRAYNLFAFKQGIKKQSGLNKKEFYDSAMAFWQKKWITQQNKINPTPFTYITMPDSNSYAKYKSPQILPDGSIIAIYSSINEVTSIVKIDTSGAVQKIAEPGWSFGNNVSANSNLVCWSEGAYDSRWEHRNYSVIRFFDLNKNKTFIPFKKCRYFSPALSNDGKLLSVVEIRTNNQFVIKVFNTQNFSLEDSLSFLYGEEIIHPVWGKSSNELFFIKLTEKGKAVFQYDRNTKQTKLIIPFIYQDIKNIHVNDAFLFYVSDITGTDNVFAKNLKNNKSYQLTSAAFGADYPFYNRKRNNLTYTEYAAFGSNIVTRQLDSSHWVPIQAPENLAFEMYETLANQEQGIVSMPSKNRHYKIRPYRKITHLFNFHSWAPIYIDPVKQSFNPGVSFFSQNMLGTSIARLGYQWDQNEESGRYVFKYKYSGLYPVFSLNATMGKRKVLLIDQNNLNDTVLAKFDEFIIEPSMEIPFDLSGKNYATGFIPGISISNTQRYNYASEVEHLIFSEIITGAYGFFAYNQKKSPAKNMFPEWGQTLSVSYKHSLFNNLKRNGDLLGIQSFLFFPGFFKHDGFRLYAGAEYRNNVSLFFSNFISYPRGYTNVFKEDGFSLKADYKFPVWYPDLRIGGLMYLKRLKMDLFCDYADNFYASIRDPFMLSTGTELMLDLHLMRYFAPFEIGVRSSYIPKMGEARFNLLFSTGFESFTYRNKGKGQ